MAPRRGGSSSGSGGISSSTCPNAFQTTIEIASFANDVIFFAIFLGIFIAVFIVRKKGIAGKGLLGLPLIGCLFFFLLTYMCSIIATVLVQCGETTYYGYYAWQTAIVIFNYISFWLFLVVVVFTLNSMLRKQLDVGHSNIIFKIVPIAIVALLGVLSCVVLGISAYINYTQTNGRSYSMRYTNAWKLVDPLEGLRVAYYSLYLVSLLVSGGLALMTIMSLRKASKAGGDLIGWVVALTIAMVFWVIIMIVFTVWSLNEVDNYTWETSLALSYLVNFGQALSFIFLLCIAKHVSWRQPVGGEPMAYHSQYTPVENPAMQPYAPYGYNTNVTGQAHQYHEAPEYVSTSHPVRA